LLQLRESSRVWRVIAVGYRRGTDACAQSTTLSTRLLSFCYASRPGAQMTNDFWRTVSQPHAPSLDLLGSYFPAWMLCAAAGIVAVVVVRQLLAIVGVAEYVVAPLLTYAGLALSATWLIWLFLFGH
jgi:hypothetical protein